MGRHFNQYHEWAFVDGRHSMVMPKVGCVVSPYEADAQLAHLYVSGLEDAVVTEVRTYK